MGTKRLARRPRSDDSKELGRNGGYEGSDEPKEMPLKRGEQPSPPAPEDAGAQGSGEASPARSAPRGGVATRTTRTTSKRVKKPSPASPARDPLLDVTTDAGHNKRPATPKPGEKRSPPLQQEEERPVKRAAGSDGETVAASAPQRKEKVKSKRKKKKQIRKRSSKLGLSDYREDTAPSPDIPQEGTVMAEQEQSNTSPPQDEHRVHEEEQQEKKMAEQEHASDTSPPHDKDMHIAHGEEQPEKEVAKQENADDTSLARDNHSVDEEEQQGEGILQQEQLKDTSPPQEKNRAQEVNVKALQGRSTKPRSSAVEKKPAVERSWSYDDELKILNALVVHAQSHDGALPESSYLLANLTFDKIDANEDKLADKIRKLRTRYHKWLLQGCPSDGLGRQLFKLSEILWGQVDEDEQVEPTSRDFSVLSKKYPHLANEVKAYAQSHSSGDLIMAMFMTIGDEKARNLDAKCKKQQIEALKLELGQASLTNELLSALSSTTRVKF